MRFYIGAAVQNLHGEWQAGFPLALCVFDYANTLANGNSLGPPFALTADDNHNGIPDVLEWKISECWDLNNKLR